MTTRTSDHELNIGGTIKRLNLVRDNTGRAMYSVIEEIPRFQNPLEVTQQQWIDGHGQADFANPEMYFEGQAIDTTQDGRVFLGPLKTEVKESDDTDLDSAPVVFCWFPATSEWLCATAGKIYRYNVAGNLKWTAATTTINGVTDLKVFGSIVFAARGASTLYSYSTDGDTWTATDLTDGYANKFLVAPNPAGTADILWKFKTPNEVSSTTDGRTVAAGGVQWTSPAYVGDSSSNIINLFLVADNMMVGRVDQLFNYDSEGGIHPLLSELLQNRSTTNFKHVVPWQGGVYFSLVTGMGEIIGYNNYEPMGPLKECEDIGKTGTIVGLAADKDWLYVAVDEGTNTHIYKGRQVSRGGRLRWQWCPWIFLGTKTCATMAICQHSDTDRRLWFGYTNTTAYVVLSDNPTADSAAKFDTSNENWLRMSYIYGTNRYWDKMIQSIITQTKGCSATITVQPKYRKNTDTSATNLTAAITTNGTVKTNLTTALTCNRIQFELHLTTDDNTKTPEVSFFQARGIEKPETVRIHEAVYSIGDTPSRRAETIRTFLRGGRTSTTLIKFADLRYGDGVAGTGYVWVVMEPGFPQELEVEQSKNRAPELAIKCRFQEVSFTIS